MHNQERQSFLLDIFIQLRHVGFELGIAELLAAFQAVNGGWGSVGADELKAVVKLLWCNSLDAGQEFDAVWETALLAALGADRHSPDLSSVEEPFPEASESKTVTLHPPIQPDPQTLPDFAEPKPFPIRTPFRLLDTDESTDLTGYWPISRRLMVYNWRYLRRPVSDGPFDVLDIRATVDRVAHQGFFLAPVYRRRQRNHAYLVLFVDQGGSMMPFHRFTRDIVETAQYKSNIEQVDVFYFHNVPENGVYRDSHMTVPASLTQAMAQCDNNTSVLVISDAGAARGYRRLVRIKSTASFLFDLHEHTALIAWLNPMPEERWSGSSAQIIANLVPMFAMHSDGFRNAIDRLRGQHSGH